MILDQHHHSMPFDQHESHQIDQSPASESGIPVTALKTRKERRLEWL
jgi:hypothetical protein